MSVCLCVSIHIYVICVHVSLCVSVYVSVCTFVCMYVYKSI